MSYWVYVRSSECSECGSSNDIFEGNMTSNVSSMWTIAMGFPLRFLDNVYCDDAIPYLRRGVRFMSDAENQQRLIEMEPSNGWGDRDSARQFLMDILSACNETREKGSHNAKIYVSY